MIYDISVFCYSCVIGMKVISCIRTHHMDRSSPVRAHTFHEGTVSILSFEEIYRFISNIIITYLSTIFAENCIEQ